eukprot:762631-Amorphochlora_amoeboformis.AAC.1
MSSHTVRLCRSTTGWATDSSLAESIDVYNMQSYRVRVARNRCLYSVQRLVPRVRAHVTACIIKIIRCIHHSNSH